MEHLKLFYNSKIKNPGDPEFEDLPDNVKKEFSKSIIYTHFDIQAELAKATKNDKNINNFMTGVIRLFVKLISFCGWK